MKCKRFMGISWSKFYKGEDSSMKHAFIFGGTGMLADVSRWLIKNSSYTSVLARNRERLKSLESNTTKSGLNLVSLDYKNIEAVKDEIKVAIKRNGAIDMVIAWIHSDAPKAIPKILQEINSNQKDPFRFFHIKGSSHNLKSIQSRIALPNNCIYHAIQLGFIVEGQTSRWLTHDEISDGIISAIKQEKEVTVIGQLEPWDMKP